MKKACDGARKDEEHEEEEREENKNYSIGASSLETKTNYDSSSKYIVQNARNSNTKKGMLLA